MCVFMYMCICTCICMCVYLCVYVRMYVYHNADTNKHSNIFLFNDALNTLLLTVIHALKIFRINNTCYSLSGIDLNHPRMKQEFTSVDY